MPIYVGNLSYDATERELETLFAEFGTVTSVKIPTDRDTGRVRGFAFVELGSNTNEADAIEALDETEFMGRKLKVNEAKPRERR